jgi:DNA-binding CsgD family transcriptional regulator
MPISGSQPDSQLEFAADWLRPGLPVSPRERQCLALLAVGLSRKEVAGRLEISVWTVRTYLVRARAKLGASTDTQAAVLAVTAGPS